MCYEKTIHIKSNSYTDIKCWTKSYPRGISLDELNNISNEIKGKRRASNSRATSKNLLMCRVYTVDGSKNVEIIE